MKKQLLLSVIMLLNIAVFGQKMTVKGKVTDTKSGETLVGVNVVLKGTKTGTITDVDGNYQLNAAAKGTIVFTYVGYLPKEMTFENGKTLDISLDADDATLKELVVVGYGTQRKSDLTGSVATVKSKELTAIATPSVEQALQGKVAGLMVTPSSGAPGAGAILRIRGTGTIGNANPFYVVDGMLLTNDDISFLNANDIESVEVLKDASATAIYGSRGANGVIIITTKKGMKNEKAAVSVTSYFGQQSLQRKINLTNATDYATLINEALRNQAVTGGLDPTKVAPKYPTPSVFGVGTDWQDAIFRSTAPMQNLNIAVRGGSENVNYSVSGDYFKQEGILKNGDYERLTLRINNEYKLSSNVKIGHNFSLINVTQNITPNTLYDAYYAAPTVAPVDSVGKYGNVTSPAGVANPVASLYYNQKNKSSNFRTVGNVYLDVQLFKGLTFRSNVGLDWGLSEKRTFVPVFFVTSIQKNDVNSLNVERNKLFDRLWENTLNYETTIGKHRFNVLGGYTAQMNDFYKLTGSGQNLLGDANNLENNIDDFLYLKDLPNVTSSEESNGSRLASLLFRVNYTFNDRYLLTASFRRDGSSKFGPNKRFGSFPSVALGWRIKEEGFLKNKDWLSNAKLRASWGVIGNEKIDANAVYPIIKRDLATVFGPAEKVFSGGTSTKLANPNIQWEETEQADVGVELGFLNNRLTAEIDWYRRVTDKILIDVPIAGYVGAEAPVINAAKVLNSGFDINVGWRDRIGDFGYNFNAIVSTIHNEVLGLGEGKEELLDGGVGEGGKLATRTIPGLPIGAFFGYKVSGVYQNLAQIKASPKTIGDVFPGDLIYTDVDGNDTVNTKDRTYFGSPIPNLTYSFNVGFDFKGFDFSAQIMGVSGNKIINAKRIARFSTGNFENTFLSRWTGEGTSNNEPRVTIGGRNYEVSERFLEDGAFVSLRNVQIGYSIPLSILSKIRLKTFRIYVGATNLALWTKYTGYTPEVTSNRVLAVGIDSGVYPVARTYTIGVSAGF